MSTTTSLLSETEIHGLVDGHIEADRRADVLRRAAMSESVRERIEAWQDQADMIRAAFRGIDKEPVPAALDLKPPARIIRLAPANPPWFAPASGSTIAKTPLARAAAAEPATAEKAGPKRSTRVRVTTALTVLVVGIGLSCAWLIADGSPIGSNTAKATQGTVEDVLAQRTAGVLTAPTPILASTGSSKKAPAKVGTVAMPTSSIPDLTSIGFTFSGAEFQPVEPASIVFRYRNSADEQIVIGVAQAPQEWRRGLPGAGRNVVVWRVGNKAYAIGGTLQPDRLRAIATSLRDEAIEE